MSRGLSRFKKRQGEVYQGFGKEVCPGYDFSDEALTEFYDSESTGKTIANERNGFALGKKWAGVAVDQWETDIKGGLLQLIEVEKDYQGHDWFLRDIRSRVQRFESERFDAGKSFSHGLMIESLRMA